MSFLYLSCAIMDSPGGKFNSHKSKRLASLWQSEIFQTAAEDFRMAYI